MLLIIGRLSTVITNATQSLGMRLLGATSNFHSLSIENSVLQKPRRLYDISVRYIIRNHFPRPSERKRIKRHGWAKRMSTPAGQRIIMRKILKGKHVLTH